MFHRSILAWSPTAIQMKMKKEKLPQPHLRTLCATSSFFFFAQTKTCRCRSRVTVWLKGVTASRSPTLARMKAVRSPFFLIWILEGQKKSPAVDGRLPVSGLCDNSSSEVMNLLLSRGFPTVAQPLQGNVGHHRFQRSSFSFRKPDHQTGSGSVWFLLTGETPTDKVFNFHSSVVLDRKMKNTWRYGFEWIWAHSACSSEHLCPIITKAASFTFWCPCKKVLLQHCLFQSVLYSCSTCVWYQPYAF